MSKGKKKNNSKTRKQRTLMGAMSSRRRYRIAKKLKVDESNPYSIRKFLDVMNGILPQDVKKEKDDEDGEQNYI